MQSDLTSDSTNQQHSSPRSRLLTLVGVLLILSGVVLGGLISLRLLSEAIYTASAQSTPLAVLQVTPVVPIASLSAPRLNTPQADAPSPVETPRAPPADDPQDAIAAQSALTTTIALPPIRIVIAKIGINARVQESEIETWSDAQGQIGLRWADPGRAVGHLGGTMLPGQPGNMVFTGHNNWLGEVFRRLPELKRGDEIIVYTDQTEHRYQVDERWIVPYRRDPERGKARLKSYVTPTEDERLTLISCYPYLTNADRIVIIARPVAQQPQPNQGEP